MFVQPTCSSNFVVFVKFFVRIIFIQTAHCGLWSVNTSSVTNTSHFEGKIVGGKAVSLSRFPFQAQLFNSGALCSGTILNSWTILTSAHCLDHNKDTRKMRVQAGKQFSS